MAFLDLTTEDSIRAALGVSSSEVTDAELGALLIEEALKVSLDGIDYALIISEGTAPGATVDQVKKYDLLRLYATYYAAAMATPVISSGMQVRSDGKNSFKRFANFDWSKFLTKLSKKASYYLSLLKEELGVGVVSSPVTLAGAAIPDYDPVTNT